MAHSNATQTMIDTILADRTALAQFRIGVASVTGKVQGVQGWLADWLKSEYSQAPVCLPCGMVRARDVAWLDVAAAVMSAR